MFASLIERLGKGLGRLAGDRRGNFAVTTAVVALPMLMLGGLAVDYTRIIQHRTKLQHAADAAVLAAIAEGSEARARAYRMKRDGEVAVGRREALAFFVSNLHDDPTLTKSVGTARVARESDRIIAEVGYSLDLPLAFGGFLGAKTFTITGQSVAEMRIDAAIDFYLLLDNTPSMGLGATPADIATLIANTPDRCAFACHALNDKDNYYSLAKQLGVAMRIDVVRQATQQLTETATEVGSYPEQFRMAVYSFGEAATNMGLTEVARLSANMTQVRNATAKLDLMTIPYQNYNNDQQTDFDGTITDLNRIIPDPGTGIGGSEPQKVVFFVSDGVGDSYKPYSCTKPTTKGRCQEPIVTSFCESLKARGIKVAVLYTTYLPLPTNSWYNTWIRPFQDEIPKRMQACASPGLFFEVSPSQGIPEAMDALFRKTLSYLRLTS